MKLFYRCTRVITLVLLVGWPTGSPAVVIFDNYAGAFFWQPESRVVTGPDVTCDPQFEQAMSFVPAEGDVYLLRSVTAPLTKRYGGPCPIDPTTTIQISLYSDNGGMPGAPLESVAIEADTPPVPGLPTGPEEFTAYFSGQLQLHGGTRYWVVLSGVSDSNHGWSKPAPTPTTSSGMYRLLGGVWSSAGMDDLAFKVEGDVPVPVESTSWGRIKALYRDAL